jgi:hypothetical protein
MPAKQPVIPSFHTEKEEAEWWETHRADVESGLRGIMKAGNGLTLGDVLAQAKRKKALQSITLRLDSSDIAAARLLAREQGMG